jgi:RHS repeat-associated protein
MAMMQHRQIRYIGVDVHKASIAVAIAEEAGAPTSYGNIANDPSAVRKLMTRLGGPEVQLRVAYEAGPTGSYIYDSVGNRLSWNSTSYTCDRADRIKTAGGTTYGFNPNGDVTARGTDSFVYDQADRLTSATIGATASTYVYDGDGKRFSSTTGGTTTRYVYDVSDGLPTVLDVGTRKYVWGPGGLAYTTDTTTGNVVAIYQSDGLGSVRALTDATGAVVQTYRTDAFGIPTATQGTNPQPFGYTGEQVDPTSLVYLRSRMYDPGSGRMWQRDPVPGVTRGPMSLNRYAYTSNNPVTMTDPSGRIVWIPALIAIGQWLAA